MLKNFFKTAFRNFWRHKVFAIINITGLAIGISAALVIYLIVHYEFSFDKFRPNSERIYRVTTFMKFPGDEFPNSGVPAPIPNALRTEITGIDVVTSFHEFNADVRIPANDTAGKNFRNQKNVALSDDNYFRIFRYNWLAGSPDALKDPDKVVLTRSRAELYFGKNSAERYLGKTVAYNDTLPVTVGGIIEDEKRATDFQFSEFISLPTASTGKLKGYFDDKDWGSVSSSSQCFVLLSPGKKAASLEKEITDLRNRHGEKETNTVTTHHLQALDDIHFNSKYGTYGRVANKSTLYGLLGVAAFLLLLGCINFINLTTAQAAERAKEIGIRKTLGSSRTQLIIQFFSETFLLTFLATLLSVLMVPGILKIFSDFVPAGLKFALGAQPHLWQFLVLLVLFVTLLAGAYPSLILSGFQPISVIKNQVSGSATTRKALMRKSLTVAQFVIAQAFIIGTVVVSKQIRFALSKDLGYKKDAIVFFSSPWKEPSKEKRLVLYEKLRAIPDLEIVSLSGNPPASFSTTSSTVKYIDGAKELETTVEMKNADSNYFRLYNMKFLAGRAPLYSDTTREYAINHSYAKFLQFKNPEDAIGKTLNNKQIVGVLQDFHTKSLHADIKPLAYSYQMKNHSVFSIALKGGEEGTSRWSTALKKIEQAYKEVYPAHEYEISFFDESIASFYKAEQNISRLLTWATGLAILISCLGLLGLVIYTTNQRVKEIGVRKVLGASVPQIVKLLSVDLLQLVLIAFIIAAPIAFWAMNNWLENFVYRTGISWWIFLLSGIGMLAVALITLSFRTIRAAMANPVKNLRTE